MRQIEALKLLAKQNDKTEFKKEYKKVLDNVESLKDSEEKSHALADLLMHGVWWMDGEKNEELYERTKAEALAGHNDEVMQSVVSGEAAKFSVKERVEYMINTQVPFLEENNFPLETPTAAKAYSGTRGGATALYAMKICFPGTYTLAPTKRAPLNTAKTVLP